LLTVLSCLTVEHDWLYVALAAAVCVMGSILSMRLLARVRRHSGLKQAYMMSLAGLVAGGTVWTTHFAAMLGYQVPMERAFQPSLTFLSMGLAIGFSTIGFLLTTRTKLSERIARRMN
jgi:NO-binding membrane sensor protein with MHYT domain